MELGLKGRRALVTGSHRGTGEATARVLAKEGAHVLVHGFEAESAEAVAASIREAGGEASAVWGDLLTDDGAAEVARAAGGCGDPRQQLRRRRRRRLGELHRRLDR